MAARQGLRALFCLLLACAPVASAAPATGAETAATAYFVVGAPGASVDVVVDGETVESGASVKSVIGPVDLSAGRHTVVFRSDDWTARTRFLARGGSVDVVVHRPADPADDPTITVFSNDLSPLDASEARLTIAHTAVVPPADVRASGEVLFENIANGEFVTAEVPPATYSVDIVATGGSDPVFGPVDVALEGGVLTRVFAIGDPERGSMDAIVQVLDVEQAPPTSVGAGLATPGRSGFPVPVLVAVGLVLLTAAAALASAPARPVPRHARR